ncbi:lipocalin-like domain-containing protein [Marinobacter halotolerans]|uniref:lipocalin-like domain-containing protein n=1 Tax=Marinobacter halotolerans TaxID=1569211 RepID=UPI001246760F|nr:lipocalin-like domain-containing protein [Marinobacter halotolerans]
MSRFFWLVLVAVLAGCSEQTGQGGFAGLTGVADSRDEVPFLQPGPGDQLGFPEDFGPHPQHRIEWWYLTANLETAGGDPLGLQWTQFRQAIKPRPADAKPPDAENWPLEAAWMAHAAVSFDGRHYFAEKLARGDVGHAGARADPLAVWLDDWQLAESSEDGLWRLQVEADSWSYDLSLQISGNPVAHGDQGFSAKSATGEGSMYFSLVDIRIAGTVTVGGKAVDVSGRGWFDREWSSQLLKTGQQGWDWFALHLEDGHKLMAFRLREDERNFLSGSWIAPDGSVTSLEPDQIELTGRDWRTSENGRVPGQFRLQIPDHGVDVSVSAPPGQYWNDGLYPYWESPVTVEGSHAGVGYMELTGYGR